MKKIHEKLIEKLLLISAIVAVLAVTLITYFIFVDGLPVMQKYGLTNFIASSDWHPLDKQFGLLPMIAGSFLVTLGALAIGVPLSIGCAIFLAEIAPKQVTGVIRPAIELLAGIPSVVYGFYGLVILVPLIRELFGGRGFSILAGSVVLAIMILPTVVNISEDAIRAVPREYKEGSLALGATHWQTIKKVIIPSARSGILTAVVLGMGRAIGETMAVIMVVGNVASLPESILDPVRTLTGNIAIEMGYAAGEHAQALFATGIVLFVIIMILNFLVALVPKRIGE
ncbi:phosphate ABC transporter permease subunit PstC [Desulforamulus hydrothermalis]|uniref:Putative ABC transporter permease protein yqgH n=1 Tax=Desulforamulus hydrothermalis Lam5 = DSM 18033 TaxID=1121428 RepID=K8EE10_9FIRM|nr:phosphate ABC transporter permease subunit PstC [Desulforamulus hydrothermalis]CCO07036.1 putative ABC transporter permease protein yqgH [Desulforamulus hydrothermalis Lam5 = DSM 18033]SHG97081.1 phosphate ABC transporter membrane protein 1, PhoT family [Desulforamulus hydrothermalis Lam5 = DSM 18033]